MLFEGLALCSEESMDHQGGMQGKSLSADLLSVEYPGQLSCDS